MLNKQLLNFKVEFFQRIKKHQDNWRYITNNIKIKQFHNFQATWKNEESCKILYIMYFQKTFSNIF